MPDRDTDLTRLLVRDLDDIPLPPQGRWRPTPRERSPLMTFGRALLTTAAVVAVLALALVAGAALRVHQEVAAPRTPTATSVTPAPVTSAPVAVTATLPSTGTPAATVAPAGAITGRLEYPSEFIPPLTVYAVSVSDPRVFFSVDP